MAKPTSEDCLKFGQHIEENSYAWTDDLESYTRMLQEKQCKRTILKSYKKYDTVNHLNNVNSFHNEIEKQYDIYRGVASKYINRYNALFCIQREVKGMDAQEILVYVLKKLKYSIHYFLSGRLQQMLYLKFLFNAELWLNHQTVGIAFIFNASINW